MKIIIMYATAGHGHKKAAEYLYAELIKRKEAGAGIDVLNVDLFDKTPPSFPKWYGGSYKYLVSKTPWLWWFGYNVSNIKWLAPLLRPLRRVYNDLNARILEAFLIREDADILLFAHFFPPEVATSLRRRGKIRATIVTLITDCFPHFTWINPGTDYYLVMSEASRRAVAAWGIPEERVKPFGLPVGEQFLPSGRKQEIRRSMGLQPDALTLLLTSGSFGIGPTEKILDALAHFNGRAQAIVVCGTNKGLYEKLSEGSFPYPVRVCGFVDNMHELMEASDLIVAKTGGLTTTESLTKEVPLVISRPIPGQEAGNARYLMEHNCSFPLKRAEDIVPLVDRVLNDPDCIAEKIRAIKTIRKPQATKDIVDFVLGLGN